MALSVCAMHQFVITRLFAPRRPQFNSVMGALTPLACHLSPVTLWQVFSVSFCASAEDGRWTALRTAAGTDMALALLRTALRTVRASRTRGWATRSGAESKRLRVGSEQRREWAAETMSFFPLILVWATICLCQTRTPATFDHHKTLSKQSAVCTFNYTRPIDFLLINAFQEGKLGTMLVIFFFMSRMLFDVQVLLLLLLLLLMMMSGRARWGRGTSRWSPLLPPMTTWSTPRRRQRREAASSTARLPLTTPGAWRTTASVTPPYDEVVTD